MLDFVLEKVGNLAHKLTTKLQAKVLCLMKLVKQLGKQVVTSHLQKERHDHTSMSWHSKDKSNLTGKNYDRQNYTNYTKKKGEERLQIGVIWRNVMGVICYFSTTFFHYYFLACSCLVSLFSVSFKSFHRDDWKKEFSLSISVVLTSQLKFKFSYEYVLIVSNLANEVKVRLHGHLELFI